MSDDLTNALKQETTPEVTLGVDGLSLFLNGYGDTLPTLEAVSFYASVSRLCQISIDERLHNPDRPFSHTE